MDNNYKQLRLAIAGILWVVFILALLWTPEQYLRSWLGGRLVMTYVLLNLIYSGVAFYQWLGTLPNVE